MCIRRKSTVFAEKEAAYLAIYVASNLMDILSA